MPVLWLSQCPIGTGKLALLRLCHKRNGDEQEQTDPIQFKSMSLELYFATLISTTGAVEFVLEADNAARSPSKKIRKWRSVNVGPPNAPLRQESLIHDCNAKLDVGPPNVPLRQESVGPPKVPLRQESNDELDKRALRETQEAETLEYFYNEVAPGIRPSKKCLSLSWPNHELLRSGIMAEIMRLADFEDTNNRPSEEPKSSLCDYLDAVQDVVASARSDRSTDKERRWSCSSIPSAKAQALVILEDLDEFQTLQRNNDGFRKSFNDYLDVV
jgi:hypothetical protein